MASLFRKLISREFGVKKYNAYFFLYEKKMLNKSNDEKLWNQAEVYQDIYEQLKHDDIAALQKKLERLSDTMYLTVRIGKTYIYALLFYLTAVVFLVSRHLLFGFTIAGLLLMSACFLYKTYEFVVNKFCYIDAHIILVYKSVLEQLIVGNIKNWHS